MIPVVTGNGIFNGAMPTLHSAKTLCQNPATATPSCAVNFASDNPAPADNNNLHIGVWGGDNGTNIACGRTYVGDAGTSITVAGGGRGCRAGKD